MHLLQADATPSGHFVTTKYFTGRVLEGWPVYLRDRSLAAKFPTKELAEGFARVLKGDICWEAVKL